MHQSEKYSLSCQYYIGRIASFILGPLAYLVMRLFGYRIRDMRKLRKACHLQFQAHPGPWIICPNHLTMIDSAIVTCAIAPMYRYALNFRSLPWNLPERANFQQSIILIILCYLTKCIAVSRGGDREEMRSVLDKCIYLLKQKQPVMIFPEGRRTRIGRIDTENFSYGVGYLINNCEDVRVMCIYSRGDHQEAYSNLPRWGERFTMMMDVIKPESNGLKGLRVQRHYAEQIIKCLAKLEEKYFVSRGQRYNGFGESTEQRKDKGSPLH